MTFVPDIAPIDLVRAVEAYYELQVTLSPRTLSPGVHSRAWLVDTTQGSWVVKLSHPDSDPIPKLERQIQLSNYLSDHGIHAPQYLPARGGSFIAMLTIDQQDYLMQLMKHEILSRVQPESASEATFGMIGDIVARFHQILDRYPERDSFRADHQKSANEWGIRESGLWPLVEDVPDLSRISHEERAWFHGIDQCAVTYLELPTDLTALSMAVLHGDFNIEHIQSLPDGSPYLYDFGDMCWGPIAHELGVCFLNTFCASSLSFVQWEAMHQHILKGYTGQQPLSHVDQSMISVFIVNRAVAWAQYSVELAHELQLAIDWNNLKRAYELVEYLLHQVEEGPPQ